MKPTLWPAPAAVHRYAATTWTPPFKASIPSDLSNFVSLMSPWVAARRRLGREFNLWLRGQTQLRHDSIGPARRLLWIYKGTPQVGDSLMDLASRVLLHGCIERVDLLIDEHLVPLYAADKVFDRVAHRAADLRAASEYDLVLLHSASSRSVRDKLTDYPRLPFVHVYGYFTGPEFNRTLFGFYRIAQLLGIEPDEAWLAQHGRPVMWASDADVAVVDTLPVPADAVALALGGVRDWRTYSRWVEVLEILVAQGWQRPWVLVGAGNGGEMRDQLLARFQGRLTLVDAVGRLTLCQTFALLGRCSAALCADGGLLHVAHAADLPVVGLFAGIIDPSYRVTAANRTLALHGQQRVDDIAPDQVVGALQELIGRYPVM